MIAKARGVSPSNIILGCGSGELLRAAVMAFTSPTRGLVAPEPTFEAPANFARVPRAARWLRRKVDSKLQARPRRDGRRGARRGARLLLQPEQPDGDACTATTTSRRSSSGEPRLARDRRSSSTRRTTSTSPTSRTRTAIPLALAESARRRHADVLEGVRHGGAARGLRDRPARHAQEHGGVAARLERQSARARRGGGDGRRRGAHRGGAAAQEREARAFTRKFFENAGYTVHAADANFMMVDIRRDAKAFKLECVKHKVAIGRAFPSLPTYARVSVGTMPRDEEGGRGVPHGARDAGRRVAVAGSESARRDERRAAQWDRIASATTSPAITTIAPATKYHGRAAGLRLYDGRHRGRSRRGNRRPRDHRAAASRFDPPQRLDERRRGGVALVGRLRHRPVQYLVELLRSGRPERSHRRHGRRHVCGDHRRGGLSVNGGEPATIS